MNKANNHSMKDILIRLLTPNDTLDTSVFDPRQIMYSDLRNILLDQANHVFNRCFSYIPGLKLEDVYLTGSSAGYFYHDQSDIDVRLHIINENCSYITQDIRLFESFITTVRIGTFLNQTFKAGNRFVDISCAGHMPEIMGLYSIMQNKWIVTPHRDITAGLEADDIMEEYTKRYYEMCHYLYQIGASGKLKTIEGIEELEKYYTDLVQNSTVTIREYIIYKLLNYRGILQDIKQIFNLALKEYLSLNLPLAADN